MPMKGKKYKGGASQTGGNPKVVIKGKKTYPSRYTDGLSKEGKIVMKEGTNYPSRYK